MDLRERLEAGELTPSVALDHAVDRFGVDDPTEDQVRDPLREAFDIPLSGGNAATLDAALGELAAGDRESEIETLRTRFASVCERERPGLSYIAHPAACHLHDDATSRPDERYPSGEGPAAEGTDSGTVGEDATAD